LSAKVLLETQYTKALGFWKSSFVCSDVSIDIFGLEKNPVDASVLI
jgi:hypothetical protein